MRWLSALVLLSLALGLSACGSGGSSATGPGGGNGTTASNINALLGVLLSAGSNAAVNDTINATLVQTDLTGVPLNPQVVTWNPNVLYYRYVVSSTISSITVTPFAQDTTDPPSIRVSGGGLTNVVVATGTASPSITLQFGGGPGGGADLNLISIESIAADGRTTRTYVLRITRLAPTAADLGALQLSDGVTLEPAFDRTVFGYTATAPFAVSSLTVRPTAQDPNATLALRVNSGAFVPIATGEDSDPISLTIPTPTTVTIRVTATDGLTTENYVVTITREGSADLTALTLSVGALSPTFSPGQTEYTSSQDFFTSELRVRPTAAEGGAAKIFVIPAVGPAEEVPSGSLSSLIALCVPDIGPCETSVDIAIESSNGTTSKTYTVTFIRDIPPPYEQIAYLKASAIGVGDWFGYSVAVSGDTLVAGAPREHKVNDFLLPEGAVHVYVRSSGAWSHQARLNASNPGALDDFGWSVAVSGDTLAVGAPQEASADGTPGNNDGIGRGAVYVFTRTGAEWSQQAYLKRPSSDDLDQFGLRVALSGDTLVVGAPGSDNNSGAVYIFTRTGTEWSASPIEVKASDPEDGALFGSSVAIAGNTLAVGAGGKSNGRGGVYVYERSGPTWVEQVQLQGAGVDVVGPVAGFGLSLALGGDSLAVGAPAERGTAPNTANTGGVYVFGRDGLTGIWNPEPIRLVASNAGEGDTFGTSLALRGDRLMVGAPLEDSNGRGVNNNTAKPNNGALNSGAVYVFRANGGEWVEEAYIKSSNSDGGSAGNQGDQFGGSVAMDGDVLVAGALGEDSNGTLANNSVIDSGAVYVFSPFDLP